MNVSLTIRIFGVSLSRPCFCFFSFFSLSLFLSLRCISYQSISQVFFCFLSLFLVLFFRKCYFSTAFCVHSFVMLFVCSNLFSLTIFSDSFLYIMPVTFSSSFSVLEVTHNTMELLHFNLIQIHYPVH